MRLPLEIRHKILGLVLQTCLVGVDHEYGKHHSSVLLTLRIVFTQDEIDQPLRAYEKVVRRCRLDLNVVTGETCQLAVEDEERVAAMQPHEPTLSPSYELLILLSALLCCTCIMSDLIVVIFRQVRLTTCLALALPLT